MKTLESIAWESLTHAYGSAKGVPALLRALKTASPGDNGPLYELFGTIWHQGTVYEATAHAVPFLIELASDRRVPDRVGILGLLASIATGTSYRAVHGNRRHEDGFDQHVAREVAWVADAHRAVAAGLDTFVAMTHEPGDVRLAAAHVLAQLRAHGGVVVPVLHQLLRDATHSLDRAGLLILLGTASRTPDQTLATMMAALGSPDHAERLAAVVSIARLKPRPLPDVAREAIIEALAEEDVAAPFEGLPWAVAEDVNDRVLLDGLDDAAKPDAAEYLIDAIGSRANHGIIAALLEIAFPRPASDSRPTVTARDLSPLQTRVVQALATLRPPGTSVLTQNGRRVFAGHLSQWGLPHTRRELLDLAAGRESVPIDPSQPLLADPREPGVPLCADSLRPGQRVLHRSFGVGTVVKVQTARTVTQCEVQYDEEGLLSLVITDDGSARRSP